MEFNKHLIWQILKLVTAFALIAVVVSEVNLESMVVLWQRISLPWFLLSILAFYAVLWSMARRYWLLIGRRITFHELLHIVLYQNIMGNLFATAAGAAWYVGILRNKHDIQLTNGLLSLLLARFGDLLTLLVSLSFATLVVWQQIPTLHVVVTVVIFFLMAVALLSLLMLVLRRQLVEIAGRILDKFHLHKKAVVRRIFAGLTAFSNQEIDQSWLSIGPLTGYSVLTLGTMLLFAYSSLQIFGVRIDIWPVIFVVSLTQIMTLVPIQVFGGLGLYDFTYLYLYGLFGIDRSEFAPVIVALRLCFYLTNLVLLALILLPRGLVTRLLLKNQIS
jgi:uncharacterized membrane protein YbhN (UPF0104 family)